MAEQVEGLGFTQCKCPLVFGIQKGLMCGTLMEGTPEVKCEACEVSERLEDMVAATKCRPVNPKAAQKLAEEMRTLDVRPRRLISRRIHIGARQQRSKGAPGNAAAQNRSDGRAAATMSGAGTS